MDNILKYEDYIQLNEVYCAASLGEVLRTLRPFGWEYRHSNGGDNVTFIYKDKSANGHLKHGNRDDMNRKIDPEVLDRIREIMIDDFYISGDPTMINTIPWERWCGAIKDPFKSVLKDYDRKTGKKKSDLEMLSKINVIEQVFKNVFVIQNEDGKYNLCKSKEDKTPLLDRWYPILKSSKKLGGKRCLGYEVDDMSSHNFGDNLFEIKEDGTLGETFKVDYVIESVKKF